MPAPGWQARPVACRAGAQARPSPGFRLVDVTRPAGIAFRHNNGAYGGKLLPETLGSGCAFLDYDADGWQDILLVNGRDWPGHQRQRSTLALYRNNRNGTFTDVTRAAGLDVEMYGMGVAVGDFNNDGFPDLFITCVGQSRLFRNTGQGHFVDVTQRERPRRPRRRSARRRMWVDIDRDGLPRPVRLQLRQLVAGARRVLQPRRQAEVLLHAGGVSRRNLLAVPQSRQRHVRGRHRDLRHLRLRARSRSASRCWTTTRTAGPTSFVANDTEPNKLYRNQRNGKFRDVGLAAGVALSDDGKARAGMGIDAADFDNSGRVPAGRSRTSKARCSASTGRSGRAVSRTWPRAPASGCRRRTGSASAVCSPISISTATLDLVVANGHIDDTVRNIPGNVGYAQPPHLFLNERGTFRDVAAQAGGGFEQPRVGRGLAVGDFDGDGDLDLLMTTNNGPAVLFRNDRQSPEPEPALAPGRHRVQSRCDRRHRAHHSRRHHADAHGAAAAPATCRSLSCPITFGVGTRDVVERVVITWPNGRTEDFRNVATGKAYDVTEGKGLAERR